MLALLSIFELFSDLNLVLKLFVLLLIMSFVFNHLGKGPLAGVIIAALAYFIFWDAWAFFGPVYLLYIFLVLGFTGFLIDYFFMAQPLRAKKESPTGPEMSGPTSMDAAKMAPRQQHRQRRPFAPPPG